MKFRFGTGQPWPIGSAQVPLFMCSICLKSERAAPTFATVPLLRQDRSKPLAGYRQRERNQTALPLAVQGVPG